MGGQYGITETKEALVAVDEVAIVLVKGFKKGVFSTFTEFWDQYQNNAEFKAKLSAAWDKHQDIPQELKELDRGEILELASTEIAYVEKFIEAFSS